MSAENLNKRGNPCGLCGKHHGAGPCPQAEARKLAALGVLGKGGYDQFVAPWIAERDRLADALAASQEKERLRDAVIATIDRRHWWHGNIHDAAYREAHIRASGCPLCKALAALDFIQTNGG